MESNCIVWVDVETTGLDPHTNALLEIAVLVTDTDLNILDESGFESKIYMSQKDVAKWKNKVTDYVREMHETSGLWDSLDSAPQWNVVEADLLNYLDQFNITGLPRLGGNSVMLDKGFVGQYLPTFNNRLHYRLLDVSSVAGLVQSWYGYEYEKVRAHEAMLDIKESIAEMAYYRDNFFVPVSTS